MKSLASLLVTGATLGGALAFTPPASGQADKQAAPIFVTKMPPGYRDWKLISVAHETSTVSLPCWATTWRSKPTAKRSFRSRTAPSSPLYTGVTSRQRTTTKSLAVHNPSLLDPPRTSSSWSRTPTSTPRPEAGDSAISTKTAHLATRPCSQHALPATRRLLATLSSPSTPVHIENHNSRSQTWSATRTRIDLSVRDGRKPQCRRQRHV